MNNRPFDKRTKSHDLNTVQLRYSDPSCNFLSTLNCLFQKEECRIVVSQELTARPPASVLLSEPLNITQQSPAVQEAVDLLPSLTAPPPPAPAAMIVVKQQMPNDPLPVQLQVQLPVPASVLDTTVSAIDRNRPQELTESNMAARYVLLSIYHV